MNQVIIKLENGKWLINDKQYHELSYPEKMFFDEFLIAMRENLEIEKAERYEQ